MSVDDSETRTCSLYIRAGAVILLASVGCAWASEHRDKGYQYLSPVPRAGYTSPYTRYVLVRFEDISPYDLTNLSEFIEVRGANTGNHSGQTHIASDQRTVIFEMSSNFRTDGQGELVRITLTPTVGSSSGHVEAFEYYFMISKPMGGSPESLFNEVSLCEQLSSDLQPLPEDESPRFPEEILQTAAYKDSAAPPGPADEARIMPNGVSVPSNFPHVDITINEDPDSGYIFMDNRILGPDSYNVIFDNTGCPIWYMQTDDDRHDMKVQPNGMLTMLATNDWHRFIGLDPTYTQVGTYRALNGHYTDTHELQVLENGHYLLLGLRSERVDMRLYVAGGRLNCTVRESVLQECTPQGELIFQWRAWDHFDVRDVHLDDILSDSVRFPHMNAIDIDEDGHILVSSRHLSEITKIDRDTGEIIWRLSGIPKNNDFTFIDDPFNGPRAQHAVRRTGPNRYLLFDNGNLHDPPVSRGVEYELDLDAMTASIVWQYPKVPTTSIYSHYMGNTQRLPNGHTLINWAVDYLPKLTEVRPDGTVAFEMNWADSYETSRVWRCQWQGNARKPYLIVEPQSEYVTVVLNKFGDPNVASYRIYGSLEGGDWTLLATSTDTLQRIHGLENGGHYDFYVTAVDFSGEESEPSDVVSAVVRAFQPGENMLLNGDFSDGKDEWDWNVANPASAEWTVEDGTSHFHISNGGTQLSQIQLSQSGLPLTNGQKYIFEFAAESAAPRTLEIRVGQNVFAPRLVPIRKIFRYAFVMDDPTDYRARIAFNLGYSSVDVSLDDVYLAKVIPGDVDYDGLVGPADLVVLADEWLGPSDEADLDGNGHVDLRDLAAMSAYWRRAAAR